MSTLIQLIFFQLTTFLQRLAAEFAKRWMEEDEKSCPTPAVCQYTHNIFRQLN
jgi:hypothetical protein